jgi:transmembrane sensor
LFAQGPRAETKAAEVHDVALPDGSVITVGAQSQVDYEFTEKERRAKVASGDAFFVVNKDATRPFIVSVDDVKITAVGTKFEVRRRSEGVNVAVAEGIVEVSQPAAEPIRLQQGQTVMASRQTQPSVQPVSARDIGAWRNGRLVFDNATLGDLVSDANRYGTVRIVIEDPVLAKERITSSFRAAQVEGVLQSLQAVLPLTVQRADNGDIVLRARR